MIITLLANVGNVPPELQRAYKVAYAAGAYDIGTNPDKSELLVRLTKTDQPWRFDPEYVTTHILQIIDHVITNGFGGIKIKFSENCVAAQIDGYDRHMKYGLNTTACFRLAVIDAFCEYYEKL